MAVFIFNKAISERVDIVLINKGKQRWQRERENLKRILRKFIKK